MKGVRIVKQSEVAGLHPRAVWLKARRQAAKYRLIIEADDAIGFLGAVTEMPGVMADGKSREECLADLTFALETTLADMIEKGEQLPSPVSRRERREQINIRLTAAEKADLVEECTRRGFKGLSDFVRNAALEACG